MLGTKSIIKLLTCKKPLRDFVFALDKKVTSMGLDISVIFGLRGKTDQEDAYKRKATGLHWPMSKHNNPNLPEITFGVELTEDQKSRAVDVVPYPSLYEDEKKLDELVAIGKQVLVDMVLDKIIISGADFKHPRPDKPHWEIT